MTHATWAGLVSKNLSPNPLLGNFTTLTNVFDGMIINIYRKIAQLPNSKNIFLRLVLS